jgi:hypothetical protein
VSRRIVLLLCACILGLTSRIYGQTEAATGVLTGVVTDSSGAVLPHVAIEIHNLDTGLRRSMSTNDQGYYRAALLPLGNYSLQAKASGFAVLQRTGIRLGVGQTLSLDLTLKIADVGEVVNVTAEAPVVETTRSERTQVVEQQSIAYLPINGRDFTDFVLLTPTATMQPTSNGKRIAVGGGSETTTGISVDGADYKSPFRGFQTGATAPFILTQEAVQEFEVVRSGFSAEFGRSAGARINVVTKSGGNQFHGGGFYFYRDSSLAADDAFGRKLDFRRQQFGASLGGPVLHDRLFFFGAYEQQKARFPVFPSMPQALVDAANQIVPNLKLGQQSGQFPSTNDGINGFGRVDYLIKPEHQLSVRFNAISALSDNIYTDPNRAFGAQRSAVNDVQNVNLGYNSVLGRKLNEFRYQYSRDSQPIIRNPLGTDYPTTTVVVNGITYTIGGEASDIDPNFQRRQQVTDNFSYTTGKHTFKAGADFNLTVLDEFFASGARGQYGFGSLADFLARKPLSFAQFVPLHGLTVQQAGTVFFRTKEFALYGLDSWRLLPNLTINYGLRWEGQWNDDALTNPDFPAAGPIPEQLKNFAPRLGISWDPSKNGKTAIRLGTGIFYARDDGIVFARAYDTNGTTGSRVSLTPTGPNGNLIPVFPDRIQNFSTLPANAIPLLDITFVDAHMALPRAFQWTAAIEHQLARSLSITADFEMSNTVHGNRFRNVNLFPAVRVDADGRPIYDTRTRPYPQFNKLQIIESSARATYNAFVIGINKRYSKRLQFQASYAYAHSRDNAGDFFNRVQAISLQDSFHSDGDFSWAVTDARHRIIGSSVVDMPGGFVVSNIINWQTGLPYNALLPTDANSDGVLTDRPYIGGVSVPFNNYRQPRYFNWNLRILKQLRVFKESSKVELSAELFNLTNASNLTTTNTTFGRNTFGQPNVAGTPFTLQLGGRYRF